MKITVNLINPLSPKQKIKKSFPFRGKRNKNYAKRLLKMADDGMMMIPIDVTFDIDGVEYKQSVILSTAANSDHRGAINQHSTKKIAPEVEVCDESVQPKFLWEAIDDHGSSVKGSLYAISKEAAVQILREKGLFPTKIIPECSSKSTGWWKHMMRLKF